jgi:hypothetical protein
MIPGQSIKALIESDGLEATCLKLGSLLDKGKIRPEDFSLREVAEATCGYEWVRQLDPRRQGSRRGLLEGVLSKEMSQQVLREAGEAVDVTAFRAITGQIMYTKFHQGWSDVKDPLDDLFETVDTVFDGEKIPGIGNIKSDGEAIHPGMPYPETGLGPHVFETPATTKKGLIVSLTKEAVFFDRTSTLVRQAGKVGERLRMSKLKREAATVAGVTITIGNESFSGNNHKWNGTTYNTYATGSNAIGINSLASNPLINYTSVEKGLLQFADLRDPDTGDPIDVYPDVLLVMPGKEITASNITKATRISSIYPGYQAAAAAPGNVQMEAPNPLPALDVMVSRMLYKVVVDSGVSTTNAADWWFLLQRKRAFWYMQNWPLTVVQAPPNSEKEFEQDIIDRWKGSERGTPYSADPRFTNKQFNG